MKNLELIEYLSDIDNGLFIDTEEIKKLVRPILSNRLHLNYTDHSIEHSERILEQLNKITEELMSSNEKLNKYELFILISSIYLHDIGMQFENFKLLKEYNLGIENIDELDKEAQLEFIRQNHHIISKVWIIENIKENSNFRKVYNGNPELGEIVALIAESHNINLKEHINNHVDYIFSGTKIRLKLLMCLIALGDVLDGDYRRVDIERLKHINIPQDSRLHWWKHYYISGLYYENGLLNIQYTFPQLSESEKNIYFEYFSSEIKYWLIYNKENFKNILSKNYIRFEFNDIIKDSLVKVKLKDGDYKYIENYIVSGRISTIERIRQALSQKLGYEKIDVSEESKAYVILYKSKKTKIISILKSECETNDFQDVIVKIINQIKEK